MQTPALPPGTTQQTLAIIMGDPASGAQRLSMAGGINNFGTTIGPLLVSIAIFGTAAASSGVAREASISSVKIQKRIEGMGRLLLRVPLVHQPGPHAVAERRHVCIGIIDVDVFDGNIVN